jgi:hypothetical protein
MVDPTIYEELRKWWSDRNQTGDLHFPLPTPRLSEEEDRPILAITISDFEVLPTGECRMLLTFHQPLSQEALSAEPNASLLAALETAKNGVRIDRGDFAQYVDDNDIDYEI